MFDRASPIRHLNVDWSNAQPMTLRVLHKYGGHVEAHRLIVEDRAGKRGEVLYFQVSRSIRNQSEAGRMRLREPIQRERADVLNNVLLRRSVKPVGRHARAELAFEILHPLPGPPHPHGAAQLFRLSAGKVGNCHRHA